MSAKDITKKDEKENSKPIVAADAKTSNDGKGNHFVKSWRHKSRNSVIWIRNHLNPM